MVGLLLYGDCRGIYSSRKLDLDAEESLRLAARRFRERFTALEGLVRERGLKLGDLSIDEMESLWRETKPASGQPPIS